MKKAHVTHPELKMTFCLEIASWYKMGGFLKWWGNPQQTHGVFLLKMIFVGGVLEGTTI